MAKFLFIVSYKACSSMDDPCIHSVTLVDGTPSEIQLLEENARKNLTDASSGNDSYYILEVEPLPEPSTKASFLKALQTLVNDEFDHEWDLG